MSYQYNWTRETVPASYSPISWEDKQERTRRDYGPPEHPQWKSWAEFRSWWREKFGEDYLDHYF